MSKESLEEVKRQFFEEGELSISGFEYLIAQAEEKIQLEERFETLSHIHDRTLEENQRYKQALEFYADEVNYKDMGIPAPEGIELTNISEDEGFIARQALQGGNDNE